MGNYYDTYIHRGLYSPEEVKNFIYYVVNFRDQWRGLARVPSSEKPQRKKIVRSTSRAMREPYRSQEEGKKKDNCLLARLLIAKYLNIIIALLLNLLHKVPSLCSISYYPLVVIQPLAKTSPKKKEIFVKRKNLPSFVESHQNPIRHSPSQEKRLFI